MHLFLFKQIAKARVISSKRFTFVFVSIFNTENDTKNALNRLIYGQIIL